MIPKDAPAATETPAPGSSPANDSPGEAAVIDDLDKLRNQVLHRRQARGTYNQRHGTCVLDQIPVVLLFEECVDGNRDSPHLDDTEKCVGERGPIRQEEQHTFLGPHAQLPERAATAVHTFG